MPLQAYSSAWVDDFKDEGAIRILYSIILLFHHYRIGLVKADQHDYVALITVVFHCILYQIKNNELKTVPIGAYFSLVKTVLFDDMHVNEPIINKKRKRFDNPFYEILRQLRHL